MIDFPTNPTNGQTYTVNNVTYVYVQNKNYWQSATVDVSAQVAAILANANINKINLMGY
jgi:hypothetical protein